MHVASGEGLEYIGWGNTIEEGSIHVTEQAHIPVGKGFLEMAYCREEHPPPVNGILTIWKPNKLIGSQNKIWWYCASVCC